MKFLPLLLAVVVTTLRAADATLPEFNSNISSLPPLSLRESGKLTPKPFTFVSPLPSFEDPNKGWFLGPNNRPSIPRVAPPQSRFTPKAGLWNMPVLEPNPAIDHKSVVKAPDPAVDFRMLVQPPPDGQKPAK